MILKSGLQSRYSVLYTMMSCGIPAFFILTFLMGVLLGFPGSLATDYESSSLNISHGFPIEMQREEELNVTGGNLTIGEYLQMPVWVYRSASAYLIFISGAGLFMNIVVIVIILSDSQKMTPLNWMLLNLALSGVAISGFGTPISASAALQFTWPFSHELCVAYGMIMATAGIGSITTLTLLALWQYQQVVWSNRNPNLTDHNGRLLRRYGLLLTTFIWTYTLVVTFPPLIGWGHYDREVTHISCSVNWKSKMDNILSYIVYMFVMGLFIPLGVIFFSYIRILIFIRKASETRRILRTTLRMAGRAQQPSDAMEKRVTLMIAVMIAAFLLAWIPYGITALIQTFNGDDYFTDKESITFSITVPSLFAKTSAVLNPLIHVMWNTQFRADCETFSFRFFGRRQRSQTRPTIQIVAVTTV